MKLNARKSIAAIGTAMALAVTPVAVPTMVPAAFAVEENSEEGDAAYASLYRTVKSDLEKLDRSLSKAGKIDGKEADLARMIATARSKYPTDAAQVQLDKAARSQREAQGTLDTASVDILTIPATGKKNGSDYGRLQSIQKDVNSGKNAVDAAVDAIDAARRAQEKKDGEAFTCDGATNYDETSKEVSEGSSMDGIKSMFTSSGNRVVYKNGKKECVSNREYYTDMLTKLVAVLGTVLTLITTATKISDVVMKANPMAPAE